MAKRATNFFSMLLIGLTLLCSTRTEAEPWLANRFAQNCVGCHAPGRENRPSPARRCTLSCQGCHVSPSGGGLRNHYGKWLQERWLSTWQPDGWKLAKSKPAQLGEQPYSKQKLEAYLGSPIDSKKAASLVAVGPPLATLSGAAARTANEDAHYNRYNSAFEKVIEPDDNKFMMSVPQGDPLRESREAILVGGIDIRYFNFLRRANGKSKQYSVPMNADVGAQLRPIRHASAVIEARFANGPTATQDNSEWDNLFTSTPIVKSAYVMVDDLPYNSWATYGLSRPLFGNQNPDHTNLFNSLTYGVNRSMRAVYKTLSVGTAPNVPFFNLHVLSPTSNIAFSQDSGYVANAGGRFVTYGASFMLSYWNTHSTSTSEARREMIDLNFGGRFGRWIATIDLNRIKRSLADGATDSGTVIALENKFKLWRENYLVLNYARANTAKNLGFGEAAEWMAGFKSFPVSGLEIELLATNLKNAPEADESRVQGQLHFFY